MAHILVVDDESAVREALVSQLEAMGHTCDQGENGLVALQRLHEREYDLIISDVMMPNMNGFQFVERILPYVEERIPIVILSSVDDRSAVAVAIESGVFDYLNKPTEMEEAKRVIQSALAKRAEMVRMRGRPSGRGGPIPADALGPAKYTIKEADPKQTPAGVPAFQEKKAVVAVAPPSDKPAPPPAKPTLMEKLRGLFGGKSDAA